MTRAQKIEWNRDIVYWWMGYADTYTVQEITRLHLRLTRNRDQMQMDYHPNNGKAVWLGFDPPVHFTIKDIEAYIQQKFI